MKKMKVAALGDNCVDIYPRLGRYYCTGNVVDFAVHMQRLGIPTSVISTTGDDVFGRQLVQELKMEDIDTSHLPVVHLRRLCRGRHGKRGVRRGGYPFRL